MTVFAAVEPFPEPLPNVSDLRRWFGLFKFNENPKPSIALGSGFSVFVFALVADVDFYGATEFIAQS